MENQELEKLSIRELNNLLRIQEQKLALAELYKEVFEEALGGPRALQEYKDSILDSYLQIRAELKRISKK